ncbi:hypothetical protein [Asticcacaulis sp.]|uniref:hypothetical protein n=1 Tax=Asticcacaulis sp. TaxID=1872648 RepID=UPI0031DC0F4B
MSAIDKARARLAAALQRKWDDTARRAAAGKGGWVVQAAVRVLAEQIEEFETLKSRYENMLVNQAAARERLQKMVLIEAEEVDRLRSLLAERDNAA